LTLGITCIHLQSPKDIPKVYAHTYIPQDYSKHYVFQDNLSELTTELKPCDLKFVVAGAECGVELADQLAHLPCNDIALNVLYDEINISCLKLLKLRHLLDLKHIAGPLL
jgi:hypothetical protein